jgi:hypothetical protein
MRNRIRAIKRSVALAGLAACFLAQTFAAGLDSGVKQLIVSVAPGWDAPTGHLQLFDRTSEGWKASSQSVPVLYGKNGLAWGRGVLGTDEPGRHKE